MYCVVGKPTGVLCVADKCTWANCVVGKHTIVWCLVGIVLKSCCTHVVLRVMETVALAD